MALMSIIVKKTDIGDLEILYKIEKECFTLEAFSKKQITSLLQAPNSISLLAEINGKIVGFIIALIYGGRNGKIGHVFTLDVALNARKKGVGLKLLDSLEQILREKGVNVCYLEAKVNNVAARELYRKLGYVEIRFLKGFYRGGNGIRLKKSLQ